MSRSKTATKTDFRFAPKDRDLPATQGMVQLVRTELKAEMRAGFKKMDARFAQMEERFASHDGRFSRMEERFAEIDGRFAQIDGRFAQIDQRFVQIDQRFAKVDEQFALVHAGMAELTAQVSRVAIAVEEQNARNRVVMDALSGLWTRQERLEEKVDGFEKWLRALPKAPTQ